MSAIALNQNQQSNIRIEPKAFILFGVILLFLIGISYYKNMPIPLSDTDIALIGDSGIDWETATETELSALEIQLRKALELAENGLPLTPEEMEKLEKLYRMLISRGGMAGGVIERIILLCRELVAASGAMELHLQHLQNSKNDSDEELSQVGSREG